MDGMTLELPLFLLATFAGALVAGLHRFRTISASIVIRDLALHPHPAARTATLIIAFGLLVQGYSVWKLRALDEALAVHGRRRARRSRRRRRPDLGEPRPCPHGRRRLPGALQSLRAAAAGHPRGESGGAAADAGVGFLNGVLGGITGLAGTRDRSGAACAAGPKDVQRAVFQPVAVAIFVMSALWIGARGAITPDVIKLFLIGLPALFAGTWLGMKLFGRLETRPRSGKSCWGCFWRRAPC